MAKNMLDVWLDRPTDPLYHEFLDHLAAKAPKKLTQEEFRKLAAEVNAQDSEAGTPPTTPPPVSHSRLHESEFYRQNTVSWVLPPDHKPKKELRLAKNPQYFVTYLPDRPDIAPKPTKPSRPTPTTTRVTRSQASGTTTFSKLDTGGKQVVEHNLPSKSKRKRDTIESDTSAPNKVRKTFDEHEPSGPAPSIPNHRKRRHDEGDEESPQKRLRLESAPQIDPQVHPRKISRPKPSGPAPSISNERKRRHDEDNEESPRKRLHHEPAPQVDPQVRPRKASRPMRTRPLHGPSRDPGMLDYLDRWRVQPGLPTCDDDKNPPHESNVEYYRTSERHRPNDEGDRRPLPYNPARYEHMIRPHYQLIPKKPRPEDVTAIQSAPLQNIGGPNLVSNSGSGAARNAPTVRQSLAQDKTNETTTAQDIAASIFVPDYDEFNAYPMRTRGEHKYLDDTIHGEILRFCEALKIPPAVKKQVEEMMQEIKDDHPDGDMFIPKRGNLAMCIVIACNKNGVTRAFQEIAELVRVPKSEFRHSVWNRFTKPRRTDLYWKRPKNLI